MGLVQFEDGNVIYYPYVPSAGAGYAFMVLFGLVTLFHAVLMFKTRTWYFIPMVLGGICETFGYYGRGWAGGEPNRPGPFMLQLMLILVGPVFIAATIYVTLGRYKQMMLNEPTRRCSPTSFFVLTDIIAFCTQIGGSLVQVTGNLKIMKIGDKVVLGGLIFQLCVMAVFLALIIRFYRLAYRTILLRGRWRWAVIMLAVSIVVIWVRNLVRVIEFGQGFYGFVSQNEAMLYIFDAFPMISVMILFIIFHPRFLKASTDRSKA
ncbi:unnamed protein product [Clonostachys rhizophaga]|uniref:Uncharacterized protein n=1 Tax=Clonostachys rhizophaga TaxID=160324 RepID=A0A9N9V8K2_9HYPO|nr:unnamed protein product [Clonostachys rhizophaga]